MPKIRALKPDFWTDEVIVELSPLARLLFQGLWTYACDNGHLEDKPRQIKMRILPADDVKVGDLLDELVESGRITRRNGWVAVLNFAKHQKVDRRYFVTCQRSGCAKPTDKKVTSQREPLRAHDEPSSSPLDEYEDPYVEPSSSPRHKGDGDGVVDGDWDGDGDTSRELTLHEAPRPDVDRLCELLADRIEGNGSKRPTVSAKWRNAARLMLDRDGRTEDEVRGAIEWSQRDEFWRSNILSLPKLREKYDALRLQAQRPATPAGSKRAEDDAMFDRQMARAIEREREMGIRP